MRLRFTHNQHPLLVRVRCDPKGICREVIFTQFQGVIVAENGTIFRSAIAFTHGNRYIFASNRRPGSVNVITAPVSGYDLQTSETATVYQYPGGIPYIESAHASDYDGWLLEDTGTDSGIGYLKSMCYGSGYTPGQYYMAVADDMSVVVSTQTGQGATTEKGKTILSVSRSSCS